MLEALPNISPKSLEFHNSRGDFKRWAESSLFDAKLGKVIGEISCLKGKRLRSDLLRVIRKHLDEYLNNALDTI